MKKIYTAGFDIFYPDVEERMAYIKGLCKKYGYEPYFQGKKWDPGHKPSGNEIFQKNLHMIDGCDIVAANLGPFRGEMDCGTAFECGYAFAKGKPVFGYMEDTRPMKEKYGGLTDRDGYSVEDFGYPINLMIGCSARIVRGTLEDCLREIRQWDGAGEENG